MTCKSYDIPKTLVWEAWMRREVVGQSWSRRDRSHETWSGGSETKLAASLYKLWNRMGSGNIFPPPVKAVPIPKKKSGGVRVLGVPTVADGIAQTRTRCGWSHGLIRSSTTVLWLYRPGKSALEAIAVTRRRCWDQDWVVEFDIRALFDNLDHSLLMTALHKHCQEPWILTSGDKLKAPLPKHWKNSFRRATRARRKARRVRRSWLICFCTSRTISG